MLEAKKDTFWIQWMMCSYMNTQITHLNFIRRILNNVILSDKVWGFQIMAPVNVLESSNSLCKVPVELWEHKTYQINREMDMQEDE